jgi:FKBP-type peptidyl-prolyl cis-trans isomerase
MKNIVLVLLLMAGAATVFFTPKNWNKSSKGVQYKMFPSEKPGAAVQQNDIVGISLYQLMNDSVSANSYNTGHLEMKVDTNNTSRYEFQELFTKMKVGDSILLRISVDSIVAYQKQLQKLSSVAYNDADFNQKVPKFYATKGNYLIMGIRLLDKFTTDTLSANYSADTARLTAFRNAQKLKNEQYSSAIEKEELEKAAKKAKVNKDKATTFLAKNKNEKNVITTASGLQYQIESLGNGEKPTIADSVVCHYKGTLLDGSEFDNSYKRNQPITFALNGVIKGWTELLQLLPKGTKVKAWIPSELAYGDQQGDAIPSGSLLIFDIHLIDIKKVDPNAVNMPNKMMPHIGH